MDKNITKKWLKQQAACQDGYNWFCNQKEQEEIKVIKALIDDNHLDWANWTIVRRLKYKECVQYAIYVANQVVDILEQKYLDDKQPRKAIKAAKKYIKNPSQKNKRAAAYADAAFIAAAYAAAAYAHSAADAKKSMLKILNYGIELLISN